MESKRSEPPKIKDYLTTVTILESISDAIFILNSNGKVEYANTSALKLLQLEQADLIGQCIDQFIMDGWFESQETKPEGTSKLDHIIERFNEGIFENIEAVFINKEHIVPVMLNFSVIDEKEKQTYIIITAKDITQWKQLEAELKRQQTISISRDRLRMLGELSVGLIHELTQPLGALKMRLELISSQLSSGTIKRDKINADVNQLNQLIERMEDSIQNIRSYAHQTEDEMISMVDIGEVIEATRKLIVYELNDVGITLSVNKPEKLPFVLTNRLLVEQVFVNIIKNSIDAFTALAETEDYEKLITVQVRSMENKWVEVQIEDNAEGIEPEIRDKIFEPFFTTREVDNHSGIGLTISKNVIASLGGDIKVERKKDRGAKFVLRIPITKEDEKTQLMNLIQLLNAK